MGTYVNGEAFENYLYYLIFRQLKVSSLQGSGHNQDRFDGSKTPIVMILKSQNQV